MLECIVGTVCLALGLYAGKRRAKGKSWKMIAHELWNTAVSPFRADSDEHADNGGDA